MLKDKPETTKSEDGKTGKSKSVGFVDDLDEPIKAFEDKSKTKTKGAKKKTKKKSEKEKSDTKDKETSEDEKEEPYGKFYYSTHLILVF